jgi:hypothetical protein
MSVDLADPKQSVLLDKARVVKIEIENNPCKHAPGDNHSYIDVFVVWGRDVDDNFVEYIDPETSATAQYFRISDGMNPHARPALPGVDPSSDGPPLGRCDNVDCRVWHDRGIGDQCSDCEIGTIQPYDGFTRAGAAILPGLTDLIKDSVSAFSQVGGAQAAFAAGGIELTNALDAFMSSPTFMGIVYNPVSGLYTYRAIARSVYDFLITETVPDPVFGTEKVLLATV